MAIYEKRRKRKKNIDNFAKTKYWEGSSKVLLFYWER
ncbi:hypothetical protein CDSM653_01137 [Caldanaerobacter subterraneus subsp. pacificus DSM 12653]|jgi:hypothetical protein|uniref:Uncharacterized protein n=1 Tax=Caldanaerobacter subterraneus subsp. pacificus DSM 12653 TaxID=391606 RepID=A0A0F5PMQ0_9THEO|nr:hypothetical protein CDSM653_01137 [Caldanaerobacter subterraneus subsp. pacificus DSM 12653]